MQDLDPDIAEAIEALPDKPRFCLREIIPPIARVMEISENAARLRLYRAICDGRVQARQHLGSTRIPRSEVIRILTGEEPA